MFILGELPMRRWLLYAIIAWQLLAVTGQPSDLSDRTILRHNWGVVMERVKQVKLATDVWSHVFTVELPSVPAPVNNAVVPTCEQFRRELSATAFNCAHLTHMLSLLRELHTNMTAHLNRTMTHIYDVLPPFSKLSGNNRPSRGLLNFGGEILKGLFGVLSESDRQSIEGRVHQISQTQVRLAQAFSAEASKTSSYFAAANHRMDVISQMMGNERQAVMDIFSEVQERSKRTVAVQAVVGTSLSRLSTYVNVLDHINEVRVAVERLVEGYLSPSLIPPQEIMRAINEIRNVLSNRLPEMKILRKRPNEVYAHADQIYARQQNHLLILVKFPLSITDRYFNVYELKSFPVSVPSNSGHETQITGLPFAIIVNPQYNYFVTLNKRINFANAPFIFLSDIDETFRNHSTPTCATALWKNDDESVQKLCKFEIRNKIIQPAVKVINDSYILLSNIQQLTYDCPNGTWTTPGCELCLMKYPCLCQILADNYLVAPKLQHCVDLLIEDTKIKPVNMAVLSNFFSKPDLQGLKGNSLISHEVQIALPPLEIYKHRQDALLASDREARYDLQRISELTKNNSVIYHSLADAIADDMKGGGSALTGNRPVEFFSWISQWESWIISGVAFIAVVALIVSLTVGYKLRVFMATVMLTKAQATAQQLPTVLDYFATTPTVKIQTLNSTTVQTVIAEFLPYSVVDITTLTLLTLAIVIVLIRMCRKYKQRNYFSFCIELGNEKTFERLSCIKLTGSENNYLFMATSFITSITIRWGLRPEIVIVWPTFCTKHSTLNNIYSFNGKVKVSILTAYRIYKIIQQPFYALPLTERGGKYREVTLVSDQELTTVSRNVVAAECATAKTTACQPATVDVRPTAPLMSLSRLTLNSVCETDEPNRLDGQVV